MTTYNSQQQYRSGSDYLAGYGLVEAPFSSAHEDRFLFLNAERALCLNRIQQLTRHSDLLLLVQGEEGIGKTSLLTRLVKNAMETWHVCRVTANTMMDAEQLLFQVAQGFGIQQLPQHAGQLQEMLFTRLMAIHHDGKVPILIVDDAHELPGDALLAIYNLADAQIEADTLLRIILFCEPQFEKILDTPDLHLLRERITHTLQLPPLDEEATAAYLRHRLAVAGFTGSSPFTPAMIRRIHQASQGVPARINTLALETLEDGDFEAEQVEDPVDPVVRLQRRNRLVMYVTGIILLVFTVVQVYRDRITQPPEATTPTEAALVTEQNQSGTAPAPDAGVQEKIIPLLPEPVTEQVVTSQEEPSLATPQEQNDTQIDSAEPAGRTELDQASSQQTQVTPQLTLRLQAIEPDPVPASSEPQSIRIKGEGFTAQSEVSVSWADRQKVLPKERVRFISDKQLEMTLTVGKQPGDWQVRVIDPQTSESVSLVFRVEESQVTQRAARNNWVMTQDPSAFTLQLFATQEQQNVDNFIRQHKLGSQGSYFVAQRDGKDWYSIVYGSYPNRQAATDALNTLPVSLGDVKPWVRRFDDIQASVNATRSVVPSTPRAAPPVSSNTSTVTKPANNSETAHEAWLWSQDPRNYTLQLLGARQADSIRNFLRKHEALGGTSVYFHTRHDARDWYAVVYGVYTSREQAEAAISRLPAELREAAPWIRSFASIHAELDRAEKNQ